MREYLAWVIDATRGAGLDPEALRAHYYEGGADTLPGAFVPPHGCLLLAHDGAKSLGIVAFDRVDPASCEMKRLYVRPDARGKGVAPALVRGLLAEARAAGYAKMRLETRTFMTEAIALYESVGFCAREGFHPIPEGFRAATLFLEIDL